MKLFFDTSVLVAAVVQAHTDHKRCLKALARVQNRADEGFVSAHTLAEMYATLTRLPGALRHSPEQAFLSVEENVLGHFKVIELTGDDYRAFLREGSLRGVQGGTIYDALQLACAEKAEAEKVYTLNLKHFTAVASEKLKSRIVSPE